jgi:hypothetical protein
MKIDETGRFKLRSLAFRIFSPIRDKGYRTLIKEAALSFRFVPVDQSLEARIASQRVPHRIKS